MFNKESMGRMKEGAYLINTGRGGIVNEADLYESGLRAAIWAAQRWT